MTGSSGNKDHILLGKRKYGLYDGWGDEDKEGKFPFLKQMSSQILLKAWKFYVDKSMAQIYCEMGTAEAARDNLERFKN